MNRDEMEEISETVEEARSRLLDAGWTLVDWQIVDPEDIFPKVCLGVSRLNFTNTTAREQERMLLTVDFDRILRAVDEFTRTQERPPNGILGRFRRAFQGV
jgi:hypothetical protein